MRLTSKWHAAPCAALAVLTLIAGAPTVLAQQYPAKPLRVIVPFAPGGGVDFMARLIAQKLPETLGQQVIVENRGGAGGVPGTEAALRSAPDGYTLLMISSTYPVSPSLYKLAFDPIADITPIVLIAKGPFIICVHPSLPVKTTKELIALAKARPGQINFASAGTGSGVHLATELFLNMAEIKMNHIPYKGTGPALTDTIAGQTNLIFGTSSAALPMVKAGRLRALGVTSLRRHASIPDVPTVAETALPGYQVQSWYGVLAPTGTRADIVARVNAAFTTALRAPETKAALVAQGGDPDPGTPEEFGRLIKDELARNAKITRAAGITPE